MAERAEGGIDVSVIVAVRNGAATLAQCIESVLGQEGCTVEIIIVDAMSDDGTREIVESYGNAVASYIREADRGIYDAWNKALAVTHGVWCAFLGSDDYFLGDDSIATLLRSAREPGPSPVFVYGGVLRVGGAEGYVIHPEPADVRAYLRSGRMLPHPGSLHRVDALRDIGGFDASFRIAGDMDAVAQLLSIGRARRSTAVATAMRVGGLSDGRRERNLHRREHYRIMRMHFGRTLGVRSVLRREFMFCIGVLTKWAFRALLGEVRGRHWALRLGRAVGHTPNFSMPRTSDSHE